MSSWPFWNHASTTDWFAVIVVAVEVWDREVRAKVVSARGFMVMELFGWFMVFLSYWRCFSAVSSVLAVYFAIFGDFSMIFEDFRRFSTVFH